MFSRLIYAPTCPNSARESPPTDVTSSASAEGDSSWGPNRAMDTRSRMSLAVSSVSILWIKQIANLWTFLYPQDRSSCHDKGRPASPHQWAKTTGDVSHPEPAPKSLPGIVHPSPTPQPDGDCECTLPIIQTKTTGKHFGRAAISDSSSQGQERSPPRIDCKSHYCAQVENV